MSASPNSALSGAPLGGHVVVFTGRLWSMTRRDATAHVARLGGTVCDDLTSKATMLVIGGATGSGADVRDEVPAEDAPVKLRRARALNEQEPGRIEILTEDDFCALAGLPSPSSLRRQFYPLHDILAMYPNLREIHARYLQKWGLVRPAFRTSAGVFFSFSDLAVLRHVSGELSAGRTFHTTVRILRAERQGQLTLDFHAEAEPARIVALKPRERAAEPDETEVVLDRTAAEEYFAIASALDDGTAENREGAARAYRKALEADPYLIPALINLGNLHYGRDQLVEALALYERALSLSPDVYEAHFNLGNVHHDLGHFEPARDCYEYALRLNPNSADAHFYLAVTLEKMGRSTEAKPHWRAYQRLAPNGEWIDLAREFGE